MKKGDKYLCIKDVIMNPTGEKAYTKGFVYLCEMDGCLTNDENLSWHSWDNCQSDRFFIKMDKSYNFNSLYEKLSGH